MDKEAAPASPFATISNDLSSMKDVPEKLISKLP